MVFNSFAFALFLPLGWLLYWSFKSDSLRRAVLLVASIVFYAWWDWRFVFLMAGVSFTTWGAAILMQKAKQQGAAALAQWWLRAGGALPLLVLAFFKYALFLLDSLGMALRPFGLELPQPTWNIILPVGISFYTFQALSYLIDVHRGRCDLERSFSKVLLFISFFPQLVAGPIVTANSFIPQLKSARLFSPVLFVDGLRLMLWGLLLKVVFGDTLATWADPVFESPLDYTLLGRWSGVLAFYGQIYFDFAGYSFIAIGIGKTFSYTLPENFNVPYVARSVTEFWKRWHISLSTWLRDYLFIPLGGNRTHYMRNLMLTMVLGGLWHGASWNFVIWGALHGMALCVHKLWLRRRGDNAPAGGLGPVIAAWLATQAFVLLTWVPFRAEDLQSTLAFFTLQANEGALSHPQTLITWPWLLLPLLADAFLHRRVVQTSQPSATTGKELATGLLVAFLLIVILALGTWESKAFIYFQF